MPRFRSSLVALALLATLIMSTSCRSLGSSNAVDSEEDPVVATIGDDAIVRSSVDRYLKDNWFAEQSEDTSTLYELRRDGLQAMIDQWIVENAAEEAGVTVAEFMQAQVAALPAITDEEIDAFHEANKSQISGSDDLDEIRLAIREYLKEEDPERVMESLRAATRAQILLEPPRWNIAPIGASRGPEDAPITIIEFSDYQCPFCRRAESTLAELEELYPGKLRFVYRHLPLDGHPQARPAAEAAVCAEAQDKFWEFHEVVFANQRALSAEQLRGYAEQVGIDLAAFDTCIGEDATKGRIEADIATAREAGTSATPTFFVNGRLVRGARPASEFQKLIDEELERIQ